MTVEKIDTFTSTVFEATFAKLSSGDWGLRVDVTSLDSEIDLSDREVLMTRDVIVRKANGDAKRTMIGKIVWVGEDKYTAGKKIALCTIFNVHTDLSNLPSSMR
jgi:hypothetical protein